MRHINYSQVSKRWGIDTSIELFMKRNWKDVKLAIYYTIGFGAFIWFIFYGYLYIPID